MTPTGSGAFQITASAAYQAETAAVTIAQTNVLTAARGVRAQLLDRVRAERAARAGGASHSPRLASSPAAPVARRRRSSRRRSFDVRAVSPFTKAISGSTTILTVQQAQPNGVIRPHLYRLTLPAAVRCAVRSRSEQDGTPRRHDVRQVERHRTLDDLSVFVSRTSDVSYGKATVTGTAAGFQASSQFTSSDGIAVRSRSGNAHQWRIKGT